ncbi:ATP-binding protein [Natrinema amylolyticum]|uniref:ATP-binding protein n=1 Tax=Natrinema amylolyticum TaxID=2878679 RepID=UPI001CFABEEA|nr:ATP-binding protein [Natrinema amylolyticum]
MSQFYQNADPDRAQLLPTKDTLTALKSDVTLESAILELCDNSLDAWKRSNERTGKAHIDIDINEHGERTELIVRDTAGGVPRDDAAMLFGLGKTAKDQVSGAIGTFGVGAKKSLVNLGLPFQIRSRDKTADVGWTYRITEDWFNDDEDWTVPVHDAEDIQPGTTEILIEDLNYNWNEETEQELRNRLGEAYNMFLSDEMQALRGTNYDLEIIVNGEKVEPEGIPNWSFSPFDGLHPRRYKNIELNIAEFDAPVYLHITVGLLTKKSNRAAGTDIYCQERKVASRLRNAEGGFGSGQDRLGNFNPRHQRLKVIVELETDGDGQVLPWDTQKSSIDKHNPFMRGTDDCKGVYNWLRRTVQSYFDLDADRVPQAFLEPYDEDHPAAINDGKPKVHDYSDRTQVVKQHRPDTDLSDIKLITRKAQADAQLQITREDVLDEAQVDAYIMQLERESDRNRENLVTVSSAPAEVATEHPHEISGQISELARVHHHNGVYYPNDLPEWQTARYDAHMSRHGKKDLRDLSEAPDDLPATLGELDGQDGDDLATNNQGPTVYTADKLEDPSKSTEEAEIFLVLGGDTEDERGSRVMETTRKELTNQLNIGNSSTDEVLWEELREHLKESLD